MRRAWIWTLAVLCSIAAIDSTANSVGAAAEFTDADNALNIPFRLMDDHIIVEVTVNDAMTVDMILDTGLGSEGAVLTDPEVGERLGLEYVTQIQLGGGGAEDIKTGSVAVGGSLSLPGVRFSNQQILVLEREPFEDLYAEGIIGGTLFRCVVEIDYENSVLNVYGDAADRMEDYGEGLDVTFTAGIPVVEASVVLDGADAVPVKLIVDTGVNDPLLLFTYSDERMHCPGRVIEGAERVLSEGLTGEMLGATGRIKTLKVGPFILNRVVASFPDRATMGPARQLGQNGMLGNEVLQRFAVVFDYGRARMFLKPNAAYARPFECNMAGLVLRGGREGYLVKDVVRNSPGERQGIRGGDVIVAINGRDLEEYSGPEVSEMFTKEGKTIELTLERDSERFSRSLTLERLI